tara:strand:- start:3803 stop:4387 length:585 start_codon:yes stop_codon:yes gene_type:complete
MFNGIIKNTGKIKKIIRKNNNCYMEIFSNIKFKKNEIGSSISCSGVCLTLELIKKSTIVFYLSKETLNRTIFKNSERGDIINLEKSMMYGQRISGHFVQGHVDTTAKVEKIQIIGKSWLISFKLPKKYKRYFVQKGSITINGVSLTISSIKNYGFQIAAVPKTLKLTNLMYIKKKDLVNVEFDVIGKYIKNFIK